MRKSLLRSVCAALAVVMLVVGACAWGADKRRGKRDSDSPVEAQLKLVETLLKVRVPPIRYSLDGSLNRSLDQLEHQLRESGVKLKFVRQAGESDFEAPLSGAKFK